MAIISLYLLSVTLLIPFLTTALPSPADDGESPHTINNIYFQFFFEGDGEGFNLNDFMKTGPDRTRSENAASGRVDAPPPADTIIEKKIVYEYDVVYVPFNDQSQPGSVAIDAPDISDEEGRRPVEAPMPVVKPPRTPKPRPIPRPRPQWSDPTEEFVRDSFEIALAGRLRQAEKLCPICFAIVPTGGNRLPSDEQIKEGLSPDVQSFALRVTDYLQGNTILDDIDLTEEHVAMICTRLVQAESKERNEKGRLDAEASLKAITENHKNDLKYEEIRNKLVAYGQFAPELENRLDTFQCAANYRNDEIRRIQSSLGIGPS